VKSMKHLMMLGALLTLSIGAAHADQFADTIALFKNAGQSASFFENSYGYAVFPRIGQGGLVVGGARGSGRVFVQGKQVGTTTMTQVSVGFQAGGQAYSQIVFFQDRRAFDEFTSGNFGFSADVGAIAITSSASASANTTATNAAVSGGKRDAATAGGYQRGIAVFTIARGGLMYQATVGGQRFSFRPLSAK